MEDKNEFPTLTLDDREYKTLLTKKFSRRKKYCAPDPTKLTAFIPGVIQKIYVEKGMEVKRGEPLLVLEAMKMKNDVFSPVNAIVKSINVEVGEAVKKDQVLIEFDLLKTNESSS